MMFAPLAIALALPQISLSATEEFEIPAEATYFVQSSSASAIGEDSITAAYGFPKAPQPTVIDRPLAVRRFRSDGSETWSTEVGLGDDLYFNSVYGGIVSAPLIDEQDDRCYVIVQNGPALKIVCLDLAAGTPLFVDVLEFGSAFFASEAAIDPASNRLYMGGGANAYTLGAQRRVACWDLESRDPVWISSVGPDGLTLFDYDFLNDLEVAPDGSAIYFSCLVRLGDFDRLSIQKIDAQTGNTVWNNSNVQATHGTIDLAPSGQTLAYAVSRLGVPSLYGLLDSSDGSLRWQRAQLVPGFNTYPSIDFAEDESEIAISYTKDSPEMGSIALCADHATGATLWTQARSPGGELPSTFKSESQIQASPQGGWFWAYPDLNDLGGWSVRVEKLASAQGMSLGTVLCPPYQSPTGDGVVSPAISIPAAIPLHVLPSQSTEPIRVLQVYDYGSIFSQSQLVRALPESQSLDWFSVSLLIGPVGGWIKQAAIHEPQNSLTLLTNGAPGGVPSTNNTVWRFSLDSAIPEWALQVNWFRAADDGSVLVVGDHFDDNEIRFLDGSTGDTLLERFSAQASDLFAASGPDKEVFAFLEGHGAFQSGSFSTFLTVAQFDPPQVKLSQLVATDTQGPVPLVPDGDRLYFAESFPGQSALRWANWTTGDLGPLLDFGSEERVDGLLHRGEHLLARTVSADPNAPDTARIYRVDLELSGKTLLLETLGLTSMLELYEGMGVLTYGPTQGFQVDIPSAGGGFDAIGWSTTWIDPAADQIQTADAGRAILRWNATPSSGFEVSVIDSATGSLLNGPTQVAMSDTLTQSPAVLGSAANRGLLIAENETTPDAPFAPFAPFQASTVLYEVDLPSLYTSQSATSLSAAESVEFALRGPAGSPAFGFYILLASLGTSPSSTVIDGISVPFDAADPITTCILQDCEPTIFESFSGPWDSLGLAQSTLNIPPGLAALAGQQLHLAWLGFDLSGSGQLDFLSNSVVVDLEP